MPTPTPKELKKLIKMCRELGVKSYKGDGFEFQLSDDIPVKQSKKTAQASAQASEFESDEISPEQLLWWSAMPPEALTGDAK